MSTLLPQRRRPHRHRRPGHRARPSRTAWSPGSATTRTPTAYDGADEVVDLAGPAGHPAFVDAHVHLVQTGRQLDGLDLTGCTSRQDALDRLGAHVAPTARRRGRHRPGWDETEWPEPRPPHRRRARAGRARPPALPLPRRRPLRDRRHALLARDAPGPRRRTAGPTTAGSSARANHTVRDRSADLHRPGAAARRGPAGGRGAGRARHRRASTRTPPRTSGPSTRSTLVRQAAAEAGLHATLYWGELGAFDQVGRARRGRARRRPGRRRRVRLAHRLAARAVRRPAGHCGHGYLDAEQVAEHVVACTAAGLQAGFHCIGDAALDAVAEGFDAAARAARRRRAAPARHRLEHCRDAVARGHGALRAARRHRQRAADVRRPVGRPRRHVRRAAGRAVARHEPVPRRSPRPASCSRSARTRR